MPKKKLYSLKEFTERRKNTGDSGFNVTGDSSKLHELEYTIAKNFSSDEMTLEWDNEVLKIKYKNFIKERLIEFLKSKDKIKWA
jgi:hypothetical protein